MSAPNSTGMSDAAEPSDDPARSGQQRRLDVAVALAGDPELLFLDEPTTGFDPNARRNAWEIVKNLTALGKTVFLTTHFMDEAQVLADRVAIIARGEIVVEGPPDTLAGRDAMRARIRFRLAAPAGNPPDLGQEPRGNGTFEIRAEDPTRVLHELTGWALETETRFETLDVTRPSLEDVYLEITGGEDGDE